MDTAFSTWLVTHGLQSWIHWVLVAVGAYYDEFNPLFPIHSSHQKTTYYSTLCHKRTRQTMVSLTVMCVSVAVAWVLSIATIIHQTIIAIKQPICIIYFSIILLSTVTTLLVYLHHPFQWMW
eukprot:957592_1